MVAQWAYNYIVLCLQNVNDVQAELDRLRDVELGSINTVLRVEHLEDEAVKFRAQRKRSHARCLRLAARLHSALFPSRGCALPVNSQTECK
jgi:hypothetical protein